jgi:hypothetical protein
MPFISMPGCFVKQANFTLVWAINRVTSARAHWKTWFSSTFAGKGDWLLAHASREHSKNPMRSQSLTTLVATTTSMKTGWLWGLHLVWICLSKSLTPLIRIILSYSFTYRTGRR